MRIVQLESMDVRLHSRLNNSFGVIIEHIRRELPVPSSLPGPARDSAYYALDKLGVPFPNDYFINRNIDEVKILTAVIAGNAIIEDVIPDCSATRRWAYSYQALELFFQRFGRICNGSGLYAKHFTRAKAAEVLAECTDFINMTLEEERSGYRLVNCRFVPVMSRADMASIADSMETPFEAANRRMRNAIARYSDRGTPDYDATVREAVGAVEAACATVSGQEGNISMAMRQLKNGGIVLHPALEESIRKLHIYATGGDGVRRGGMECRDVQEEDARFTLVACSAILNYLAAKQARFA